MKTKEKIAICIFAICIVWLLILMIFAVSQLFADNRKLIYQDKQTETKYIQHKNYIEVKGTDGYVSYIGTSGELEY